MRKKKQPNFEELNLNDSSKIKILDFFKEGYNKNKEYYEKVKYYCYKLNEFIKNNELEKFKDYYSNFVDIFEKICSFDNEFKIFNIKELNNTTLNKIRDFTLIRLSTVESYLNVVETEQRKIDAKIFSETFKNPEDDQKYQKDMKQFKTRRDLMIKAYNNNESLEIFDK